MNRHPLLVPCRAAQLATATLALAPAMAAAGFKTAVAVGAANLQLNGKGTRHRFAFKVYDMAVYTTKKVGSSAELLALPGPKRLHLVALRELSGTDLGRLFLRGMADNATPAQVNRHTLAARG